MASQTRPHIAAEPRQPTGRKSDLKRLRRDGYVPGSLFGHGDPRLIQLSERTLSDFLRYHAPGGIVELQVNGESTPALIRELDRDGVTGRVTTIGFQRIDMRETIRSTVPVTFVGEDEVIANHLVLERQMTELEVTGRADLLPTMITVNVAECEAGTAIRIADLGLPEGVEPTKDPDLPVATVNAPSIPADVEAALDAEEAAHAAAEAVTTEEEAEEAEETAGAGAG
ncbi:MAG: 50S ribosomal protein L25 [Armatimonadota bacterium]